MYRSLQFLILTACPSLSAGFQAGDTFTITGLVVQSDGTALHDVRPVVLLNAASAPLSIQTTAGPDGRFEFSRLNPGVYTVVAALPGIPIVRKTLDIGPGVADGARSVAIEVRLAASTRDHTVSVEELEVPRRARDEHAKSREHLGKQDVKGAIDCLKRALALAPHFSAAWNDLGTIALNRRDYTEAETCFRKALKDEPEAYPALVNLGNVLLSERKTQESLVVNQRAVKINPGDPMAEAQLGLSYLYAGDDSNAVAHLKKAKELDPSHFSYPQLHLMQIYERMGDSAAAQAEMQEFLRLHPHSRLAPQVRTRLDRTRGGN
jgi:Flp pilus assembly protein TadD